MSGKLHLSKSEECYKEALELVPGAVLGIRRPYNFVPGEYPIFFAEAKGGKVTDVDGNEYLDMLCAYGPIIIGHRETEIDDAVIDQIRNRGFCMTLTQEVQNKLARKLRALIPLELVLRRDGVSNKPVIVPWHQTLTSIAGGHRRAKRAGPQVRPGAKN
jgi:glutamate-1-semialdehyde aminotransferase